MTDADPSTFKLFGKDYRHGQIDNAYNVGLKTHMEIQTVCDNTDSFTKNINAIIVNTALKLGEQLAEACE